MNIFNFIPTKKYLAVVLLLLSIFNGNSQSWQWIQKNNFPGSVRYGTAFFTLNGKGYMGLGYDGNGKIDFWEYTPLTDVWTQKADFIGSARWSSRGIANGTDGYFFGGASTIYPNDLYKYNSLTNVWSLINPNCPLPGRQDAFSFEINGNGYITCGYSSIYRSDLWEYNPNMNTWTQKANFPGGARDGIIGFVIGGDAFVGLGLNSGTTFNDFYKYNAVNNSWTPVANFSGTVRHSAVAFSLNGHGFAGLGTNNSHTQFYTDFYEYDPVLDVWTPSISFFSQGISYPFIFDFDTTAFIGNGWELTGNLNNKVYQLTTGLTSVNDIFNSSFFDVSPNPFCNEFSVNLDISSATPVKFILFELSGKKVFEQSVPEVQPGMHNYLINSESFNKKLQLGAYLLKVETKEKSFIRKIIRASD